ncbi:hypothetical protein [Methanoculleus sp.]|uniref:hypothetical protein n=1 Tax=Methanoculleus sp. TaxID=90427 RepID=UPI0025F27EA0|nr:hypothetical protein [Methanoculleus sp.]MCK9319201.1 hypothetical protein [Methanoculleus sp.]
MENTKNEKQCAIHYVSISSLVEKSRNENANNRRKMYSNINKETKDIEPFENTAFLEMVSAVMNDLN